MTESEIDPSENNLGSEHELPPSALTVPRVLRELGFYVSQNQTVLSDLAKLQRGERSLREQEQVAIALACAKTDTSYPPYEVDGLLQLSVTKALQGKFNDCAPLAADLVEQAIAVAHTAREAVKFLDALGDPLRPEWSNLPMHVLAREINRYAHTMLRGRLPGWREKER